MAYIFWGCLVSAVCLTGCNHVYRADQLVGSWRLDRSGADARFTFYSNQTWVLIVNSSDTRVSSGTAFGTWGLNGNRVSTTTESALDNKAANAKEVADIIKLTASTLIMRNRDVNGQENTSVFHRTDTPVPLLSDEEYIQKLLGTWLYSYTNATKLAAVRLYTNYQPNGTAYWHGTIYKSNQSSPAPNASGTWRVEGGYLITEITNAQSGSLKGGSPTRDQIFQITDSQFSFRDEDGAIKKDLRTQ
jgi:hypothetical protein